MISAGILEAGQTKPKGKSKKGHQNEHVMSVEIHEKKEKISKVSCKICETDSVVCENGPKFLKWLLKTFEEQEENRRIEQEEIEAKKIKEQNAALKKIKTNNVKNSKEITLMIF